MASGSPSRRRQISATAGAFPAWRAKPGRTARARSTKSATAVEPAEIAARAPRRVGLRVGQRRTGNSCSPDRRSGARLVTSTVRPGQPASSVVHDGAARRAARSCPAPAAGADPQRRREALPEDRSPPGARRRAWAMAGATRSGSVSGASSTKTRRGDGVRGAPAAAPARGASCPPPGPGERQQPGRPDRPPDLGQLALAPDEAGELHRQAVGGGAGGGPDIGAGPGPAAPPGRQRAPAAPASSAAPPPGAAPAPGPGGAPSPAGAPAARPAPGR